MMTTMKFRYVLTASVLMAAMLGFSGLLLAQAAAPNAEPATESEFENLPPSDANGQASGWLPYYEWGAGIKPMLGLSIGVEAETMGSVEANYGLGSISTLFLDALFKDTDVFQEHTASLRYLTPGWGSFRVGLGYGVNRVKLNNYPNDCKSCSSLGSVTIQHHGPELSLINEWFVSDYDTFSIEWVGYIKTAGSSINRQHKGDLTAEETREFNKFADDMEDKYGEDGGAFSRLLYVRFGTIF